MRIIRNVGYIKRRRRAGKLMLGLGLILLASSWALTLFASALLILATAGLIFGFILFNGGLQQIARWSRNPRIDVVFDRELERLNDRYTLIHYPDLPGRRPEHLLVTPTTVLVMTPRELAGRMSVHGRRWRKLGSPLGRLFMMSAPQLGNPTIENEAQVRIVDEHLRARNLSASVEGAVVFIHDNVEVEITEPTLPVLHASEILEHVRSLGAGGPTLATRERDSIVDALALGEDLERSSGAPARPKKRVRAA